MQCVGPAVHPELVAESLQPTGRDRGAVRHPDRAGAGGGDGCAQPVAIAREAREVTVGERAHPGIGGGVDLIGMAPDRRQPAGDVDLAQPFRVPRQVVQRAEAAERLAQQAPAPRPEVLPERLGVGHDRVGAEVTEVLRVGRWVGRRAAVRRGEPSATLVEQHHPVVLQRSLQPGRVRRRHTRSWRLLTRATLQVDEERAVRAAVRRDDTCEDLDGPAIRIGVVERDVDDVVGQVQPVELPAGGALCHRASVGAPAGVRIAILRQVADRRMLRVPRFGGGAAGTTRRPERSWP